MVRRIDRCVSYYEGTGVGENKNQIMTGMSQMLPWEGALLRDGIREISSRGSSHKLSVCMLKVRSERRTAVQPYGGNGGGAVDESFP